MFNIHEQILIDPQFSATPAQIAFPEQGSTGSSERGRGGPRSGGAGAREEGARAAGPSLTSGGSRASARSRRQREAGRGDPRAICIRRQSFLYAEVMKLSAAPRVWQSLIFKSSGARRPAPRPPARGSPHERAAPRFLPAARAPPPRAPRPACRRRPLAFLRLRLCSPLLASALLCVSGKEAQMPAALPGLPGPAASHAPDAGRLPSPQHLGGKSEWQRGRHAPPPHFCSLPLPQQPLGLLFKSICEKEDLRLT